MRMVSEAGECWLPVILPAYAYEDADAMSINTGFLCPCTEPSEAGRIASVISLIFCCCRSSSYQICDPDPSIPRWPPPLRGPPWAAAGEHPAGGR